MDPLIDRHNGSVSLREAYRPADEYGVRSAVELEVDNIPVQKVIFKPFVLRSVMGGRQTYRKLHIHDLILAVVCSGKLKGNGKQREDKIPLVSRLVPHIRDALIGEGIIFALEMLALTLNDFDFEERTVSITKNYARIDGEDLFLDPKTPKSNRKITLPQFVCDMVKDYADRLYGYDPSDRLFEVTKHYLKHEMERGCKKTGLREIRVHDLRHSHASLLIELGFAPLLISERLGHESVTTTLEIYSHLYPTKHGEVADRLEAFA